MSQILIQQYLNQLQDLRKVSGTHRESVVREAFKDLLKGWARAHDLVFVRAEPEARVPAHSVLRRLLAAGRLGQDAHGSAHRLRESGTVQAQTH